MSIPKLIEINRGVDIGPENTFKIDGKEIKGIQAVKIEYGLDNRQPKITIQIIARKIKGKIRSTHIAVIDGD